MKFNCILFVLFSTVTATYGYLYANIQDTPQKRSWTVMVYMDFNDFSPYKNLKQLAAAGSNENINIIAEIHCEKIKKIHRYCLEKNNENRVYEGTLLAPDRPEDLENFCSWAITHYPADRYALVLWGHGEGFFLSYLFNPPSFMHQRVLWTALEHVKNHTLNGEKFDLIAFDACLMADLMMVSVIKNYAKVLVASETETAVDGFPYLEILLPLGTEILGPTEFAQHIVYCFKNYYAQAKKTLESNSIAALNPDLIDPVEENFATVAHLLIECLDSDQKESIHNAITASRDCACSSSDIYNANSIYPDIGLFYQNLLKQLSELQGSQNNKLLTELRTQLSKGISLIDQAVFAFWGRDAMAQAHGLSAGFPNMFNLHKLLPLRDLKRISSKHPWMQFLRKYFSHPVSEDRLQKEEYSPLKLLLISYMEAPQASHQQTTD